jgi:hypothetical protein
MVAFGREDFNKPSPDLFRVTQQSEGQKSLFSFSIIQFILTEPDTSLLPKGEGPFPGHCLPPNPWEELKVLLRPHNS